MNADQVASQEAAQQSAVAGLGLAALSGLPLPALMEMAVAQVVQTLNVPYAKILQVLPGGETLLLAAGAGWQEGLVGQATVGTGADSQAGYTLRSNEPVIVEDLATETRFKGSSLVTGHGVVSGISVVIQGREGPFGVFGAHSGERREFTAQDANFLQAVANVIGATIERQQVEDALRRSEQRLAVAVEASGGGLYEHSVPLGSEHYHSARWAEILGYRLEEIPSGQAFLDWILQKVHPDDAERQARAFDDFMAGRTPRYEMELRLRHKAGDWLWVRSFAHAVARDASGKVRRLAGLVFDINDQKLAQVEREQLLQALQTLAASLEERVAKRTQELQRRTEQLRAMASVLTLAEQRERERISRILHDDLQQLLYAAQMQATLLGEELTTEENAHLLVQLRDLERLHHEAVAVTRSLSVELSPPVLKGEGLVHALGWLKNHMEQTYGLHIALVAADAVEPESNDLRELVFQMVRELLFNVVKHAGVAQARVTLRRDGEHCVIEVLDEGQGFDAAIAVDQTAGRIGYGLRSMRERLALFDGNFEVQTRPGEGTRVVISVPATSR